MGDYLDLLKFLILKNEILVLSFSLQVAFNFAFNFDYFL